MPAVTCLGCACAKWEHALSSPPAAHHSVQLPQLSMLGCMLSYPRSLQVAAE